VGAFYSPQENLPVGVLETQICPGWGPDISGNRLWNSALEPDKSSSEDLTRDKVERPEMSRLGAGRV
jgi:hypothetical protein